MVSTAITANMPRPKERLSLVLCLLTLIMAKQHAERTAPPHRYKKGSLDKKLIFIPHFV